MFQVWPIANGITQSGGESQPNTHHEAEHTMQEKKNIIFTHVDQIHGNGSKYPSSASLNSIYC